MRKDDFKTHTKKNKKIKQIHTERRNLNNEKNCIQMWQRNMHFSKNSFNNNKKRLFKILRSIIKIIESHHPNQWSIKPKIKKTQSIQEKAEKEKKTRVGKTMVNIKRKQSQ